MHIVGPCDDDTRNVHTMTVGTAGSWTIMFPGPDRFRYEQ